MYPFLNLEQVLTVASWPAYRFLRRHVKFTGEFYQTFKEEIIASLFNLFQKIEDEETLPNSFNEDSIPLVLKSGKDITRKENYIPIPPVNKDAKIRFSFIFAEFSFFIFLDFLIFKKFIYFNWRQITLQYCSGFCHTLTWISHRCTCVPHREPPLHLPPHPIPLSHPSAPALSTLSHASNLDWQSVSHIIYMLQCYSLNSSHLRFLPQSPKDCSIHMCLFCCLAYRVIVTIFLSSIYMR